jgi:hypothetical protein
LPAARPDHRFQRDGAPRPLACHRAGEIEGGVATAVLCGAGRWRIDGEDGALQPLQGLLWRAPVRSLHVSPTEGSDAPCLVVVRLCHDRT